MDELWAPVCLLVLAYLFGGVFAFLCLRQLSQAEHPVQKEGKGPTSRFLETPNSRNFEEHVPRNSAHRCTAPATAMLIQEVRWGWNRAAYSGVAL